MSREGATIAARERARRLQEALGDGAQVLLGCTLVVLTAEPRAPAAPAPVCPANEAAHGPAPIAETAPAPAGAGRLG